eukprot:jgi/Orpsp1_1/1178732/evm.model.c7180000066530.1
MKIYRYKLIQLISTFFFFNQSINGFLIPEKDSEKYINKKIEPIFKYAKKKFSEFIYDNSKNDNNIENEEDNEKQFSSWSYIRSLKYLKENKEFQKAFEEKYNSNSNNSNDINNENNKNYNNNYYDDNNNINNNNKKKSHFEIKRYKRYALNPDSLINGFPEYISEDIKDAYKKRYSENNKRQFDDPLLSEMYDNETRFYFSQEKFGNFNIFPKNISLEHNIVKVSIPFKDNENSQIKRYLIRGSELLNNESLKNAKSFPLIDYDYENYIKNRKIRYLKKKQKTKNNEEIENNTKRSNYDNRSQE